MHATTLPFLHVSFPLFTAVHPRHGIAWTDGKNVFLSPVVVQNGTLKQANPTKLGEFE